MDEGLHLRREEVEHRIAPLWSSQWPIIDNHLEIGFRDLIELRFVKAFTGAGVGLLAVRKIEYARECVNDERPFSTRRFQTDGRTIFLEGIERSGETKLLDLKRRQYVFRQVIERTFKDLDIEDDAVARWRPFNGKQSIVIDPPSFVRSADRLQIWCPDRGACASCRSRRICGKGGAPFRCLSYRC